MSTNRSFKGNSSHNLLIQKTSVSMAESEEFSEFCFLIAQVTQPNSLASSDDECLDNLKQDFGAVYDSIVKLRQDLAKLGVSESISANDVFVWCILEVLSTDVSVTELGTWLADEDTIYEVFFVGEDCVFKSLLRASEKSDFTSVFNRIERLKRSCFG